MKIAIGVCERVVGVCTTSPCFKHFNAKTKHFEQYEGSEVELSSFFICQACSAESFEFLEKAAGRFSDADVKKVHLGACALKCEDIEKIIEIFGGYDIEVHKGTH